MMTEQEAHDRAKAAAATVYSDNLLGRIASTTAIEVARRALLTYAKDREQRLWAGPIDESGSPIRKGKSRWA